jgi:hypothetical protein
LFEVRIRSFKQDQRAGADHGDGAAQDGAEAHRHQQARHRQPGARRDAADHGQEECRGPDVLHEARDTADGPGDQRDDARLGGAADAHDEAGDLRHDPGFVEPGTDDHDRDDGDDRVARETIEQMLHRHQTLLESHQGRKETGQSEQDHDADRGDIDRDDLEGEQKDREKQKAHDPGDLDGRYNPCQVDADHGEEHRGEIGFRQGTKGG